MASVSKTAGVGGSVTLTTRNTAGQAIVPASAPVVKWYTDAARTAGELTLSVTGSGSTYVAAWTDAQAPTSPTTRYFKVTIEVSAGVFDVDADDEVSFVDATTSIDNHYVTRDQIRALPNIVANESVTDDEIDAAIDWFETTFEDYTGVAFVPRTRTVTLDAYRDGTLLLPDFMPRAITAVRAYTSPTTFTDFDADDLAGIIPEGSGRIRRWSGNFTGRVQITYTHGHDSPPADVVEAAKVAIQHKLLADEHGRQPYLVATEGLVQRFSRPGPGHPFGLDEVDEVSNRHAMVGGGGSVVIG